MYYQDFPYINGEFTTGANGRDAVSYFQDSNFGNDLLEFLFVLGVPKLLIELVKLVDFSMASGRLIFSVPGIHMDKKGPSWGLRRLARIVEPWRREFENFLPDATKNDPFQIRPSLIYQTVHSSHTPQWLREFFYSALGEEYGCEGPEGHATWKGEHKHRSYDWPHSFKILQKRIPGSAEPQVISS